MHTHTRVIDTSPNNHHQLEDMCRVSSFEADRLILSFSIHAIHVYFARFHPPNAWNSQMGLFKEDSIAKSSFGVRILSIINILPKKIGMLQLQASLFLANVTFKKVGQIEGWNKRFHIERESSAQLFPHFTGKLWPFIKVHLKFMGKRHFDAGKHCVRDVIKQGWTISWNILKYMHVYEI